MAKIMIVEDDDRNLELISRFLERAKFELLVPTSHDEAIEMAQAHRPDAVLMDLGLNEWDPPGDGIELTQQLRTLENFADVPILAVSARGFENEIQTAYDAGCTDFVLKPVDYTKLIEKLKLLCNKDGDVKV